jgi:hypothetical protein
MSPEPSGTTDAPIGAGAGGRLPFVIAALLVAGWVIFLAVLALLVANPVTINREQMLSSDAVIVAVRDGGAENDESVQVEKVLAGRGVPSHLRLPHFSESAAKGVSRFVIPLLRTRDSFEITPAPPALDGKRLVYPATPETVDAVTRILATGAARPYP